jgi:hypothetical protein
VYIKVRIWLAFSRLRTPNRRGELGVAVAAWLIAVSSAIAVLLAGGIALKITRHDRPNLQTPLPAGALLPSVPVSPSTTAAPAPRCPLSGLPPPGGAIPERPALAIKVDNYPAARPQSGLEKADIVFEEPIEAGITRLVAVFQCQGATLVGSIRSARAVDASILDQLSKPIFIHVGAIAPVLWLIKQADLFDQDLVTHAYVAQSPPGRNAPYDTYVSTAVGWMLQAGDSVAPAPLFTYSMTPLPGSPVTSIHIPYSLTNDNTWTWDAGTQRWLLSYSGIPSRVTDAGQIGVSNVIVEKVQVTTGPWTEDIQRDPEVQSQLVGSGPVAVFSDGRAAFGSWQRTSLAEPTHFIGSDGAAIALQPGATWVEIVPASVDVTTTPPSSPWP